MPYLDALFYKFGSSNAMIDDSHKSNHVDYSSVAITSDNWKDPIKCLVASGLPLDFLLSHVEEVYGSTSHLRGVVTLNELTRYSTEAYYAFHGL